MSSFADFQNEIYLAGLGGAVPELPMTAAGLDERARAVLSPQAYAYVAGSASAERTAAANLAAFDRHRIVPRMWRGSSGPGVRDLSVEVLGTRLAAPVLTAPIGVLELLHERGEIAVAEATRELGIGMVLSTAASTPIEEVGPAAGAWWYQLYWPNDDELAHSLVDRAGKAGATAIMVTADTPSMGWRPRDLELGHLPFLQGKGIVNYLSDPVFRAKLGADPESGEDARRAAVLTWVSLFGNHGLRPADIAKLREWTELPIAVKGIVHPDDAQLLVEAGADAVVVSNHGGRQVDGAIGALDALPGIVAAIGDRAQVLFDSGIRTGSDVMVALALGARAVLYGRPWAYGLGIAGAAGVRHALRLLLADLDAAMGLSGQTRIAELDRSLLAPAP
ncbi:alpha-hydroxy-acid oxidizing protein [Nocardia terpenica]|uniref:Alpha-hydroxy-acid oxidizing enzyme n=1 Tax=Nocardia terpenica TaxID=455432 RepID=A0A291RD24_9NOCA|nr:alpha-hydroxy-acid oxidizing protein [Nocardia terpenica]ATL65024.1 alpha-hydroxy-acid oxidizing enzyme [Nocardia terpenica]